MAAVTRVPTAATESRRANRSRRRVTGMCPFCTAEVEVEAEEEEMVHAAVAALASLEFQSGVFSLAFSSVAASFCNCDSGCV